MSLDLSLRGKRALVCGASKGIGRETALALAGLGCDVIALARSTDALDSLVPELHAAGAPSPRRIVADLDDREALCRAVEIRASEDPIHILINNTGGPPGGPLLEATEDEFLSAIGRHLLAAHRLSQILVPGMIADGYGRIVNVISTSVYEPIPNLGVSNTTRGSVASWAKSLSRELPPGVTINNVLPGFTDTPRLGALQAANARRTGRTPQEVKAGWLAQVPEGRLAD